MYELSQTFYDNQRDVRTLDYYAGILVTGDLKHFMNVYEHKGKGKYVHINKIDIFQKQVNCVKINENHESSGPFVLAGVRDGKIYVFDRQFNPTNVYEYTSAISSIDFINEQFFVAGSWDGKANVWSIKEGKIVQTYAKHKHAVSVFYNRLTDQVISGSQDKSLVRWNWKTGQQLKRLNNAHNDIVRQICAVQEVGLITCSNDQTIKLWTSELENISTFSGHSAFVFTVKAKSLGFYISAGQDRCIKIWKNQQCSQSIQIPASIWSVVIDQNDDILAGCSDGTVRMFTTDPSRKAEQSVLDAFNKEAMESVSKKSGMSAQEIAKLPTTGQMGMIHGKKNGDIRVFRNGNIPQAFMWQNGKWDKIGQVITQGAASGGSGAVSQPKYYPGDKYFQSGQYDHIFDVEDQSGQRKLIPYNDGGNPLDAAQRYCARQGLSRGHTEQIRKFLMQNSSRIPRKVIENEKKQFKPEMLKVTPQMSIIQYNDVKNPKALFQKIKEFNQKIQQKLSDKQLGYIERITQLLQNSSNYHAWTLDFKELDALKKLFAWPKQVKFPVWDLLRAFLRHYQSETFFSGLDAGAEIIGSLAGGLEMQLPQGVYTLIFKTLCNLAIQNTNKTGLLKHSQMLFNTIVSTSKKHINNKNYLSGVASFLYNFSIVSIQKKFDEKDKIGSLKGFVRALSIRLQLDETQDNRNLMLFAAANVLSKYRNEILSQIAFLNKYLSANQVSADIKMMIS